MSNLIFFSNNFCLRTFAGYGGTEQNDIKSQLALPIDQILIITVQFQFGFDDGEGIANHTNHNQQACCGCQEQCACRNGGILIDGCDQEFQHVGQHGYYAQEKSTWEGDPSLYLGKILLCGCSADDTRDLGTLAL